MQTCHQHMFPLTLKTKIRRPHFQFLDLFQCFADLHAFGMGMVRRWLTQANTREIKGLCFANGPSMYFYDSWLLVRHLSYVDQSAMCQHSLIINTIFPENSSVVRYHIQSLLCFTGRPILVFVIPIQGIRPTPRSSSLPQHKWFSKNRYL